MSLDAIIGWLIAYKYLLLFPVSVVEGPMITVLGGFLSKQGVFSPLGVFWVVLLGDIVGDAFYYHVGKVAKQATLVRFGKYLGFSASNLAHVEQQFKTHGRKLLASGKYTEGVGTLMLIAAGAAGFPYSEFLVWNALVAMPKVFGCVLLGYYFGAAYEQLDRYFGYAKEISVGVVLAALCAWFLYSRRMKKKELRDVEKADR